MNDFSPPSTPTIPVWGSKEQIAAQPYGANGTRRAIAGKNRLSKYDDWCATCATVTPHATRTARCVPCNTPPPTPRQAARRARLKTYADTCPTHGLTAHDVRRGNCLTCCTTEGVARTDHPRSARALARAQGAATFLDGCAKHGVTAHSVAHGKCLTCFTTAGMVRRWGPLP